MRRSRPFRLGLGVALLAAANALAVPPPSERPGLTKLVNDSDLVFRGVVERLDYALSDPSGQEGNRIPHMFVTYRVVQVLRGEAGGPTVTLRFIGGQDPRNNTVMWCSLTPRIDVGDHDILFVDGNGSRMCPLVGNRAGRLRVVGGQVFTDMGNAVTLNGTGEFVIGREYQLNEVRTTTVAGQLHVHDQGPDAAVLPGAGHAGPAAMVAAVQARILAVAQGAAAAGPFASADPAGPIVAPDLTPTPPPADPVAAVPVAPVLEPQAPDAPAPRKG